MQSDFVLQIIVSVFSALSASGFVIWLTKQWISERLKNAIKNEYDVKLETHKAELKANSDVEIEKLRSQLNLAAKEHDIVFSKLHEKRAEAIAAIYAELRKIDKCLQDLVTVVGVQGEPSRSDRFDSLVIAHNVFYEIYIPKVIFLPEPTANKLNDFNKIYVQTANEFKIFVIGDGNHGRHIKWTEIFDRCNGPIKEALNELEVEFRLLLSKKN